MVRIFDLLQCFVELNCEAVSAIVIAIQMITNYCKKLKYRRKIVLVTDARGDLDGEDVPQIVEKLTSDGIELVVVSVKVYLVTGKQLTGGRGVDFDDTEYGFKEEDKDPQKVCEACQ